MKKILFTLLTSAIVFAGCNSSEKKETTDQVPALPDQAVVEPGLQQDPVTIAPATSAPVTTAPATTIPITNTGDQPNPNANLTGMNPAHGEPGHRCDISVGAPLNSPPGNKQAPVINSSPTPMPTQATPPMGSPTTISTEPVNMNVNPTTTGPQTVTAPGMNPPHGQPGHDCAIAVGAPLKK